MQHVAAKSTVAAAAAVLLILGGATTASASTAPEDDAVRFALFESSSTFADVYDSMLQNNDPSDVAALLDSLAAANDPDLDSVQLGDVPPNEAEAILEQAAASAEDGQPLPASLRANDPGSDYPVLGEATSSRFSWTYTDRAIHMECGILTGCNEVAWINFRVTTDPNDARTASQFNASEGGTGQLSGFHLSSTVLQDGWSVQNAYQRWNTPGYGTQWNFHEQYPNNGHTFQMSYALIVDTPSGPISAVWSTAVTAQCGEPIPGAFRCLFPAS